MTPARPAISGKKNLGRFAPGVSGNPSGRPKTAHISEALRQKLDSVSKDGERSYAQVIADRLCDTAAYAERSSQSTQAAAEIADRIQGKPTQHVQLEQVMDADAVRIIANLAARLLDDQDVPPLFGRREFERADFKALPDVTQCTTLEGQAVSDEQ